MMKNKEISREEYITGLLEVNVTEGYLMEGYTSREPFDFEIDVPSSTGKTINTLVVTSLQLISTPLFICCTLALNMRSYTYCVNLLK